jgi:hypothetical protein
LPSRGQRAPIAWINTPVLMAAIERYEQGWLPHSMVLWLRSLLEIEAAFQPPCDGGAAENRRMRSAAIAAP